MRTTYSFRYVYITELLKEGRVTIIAPNDDDIAFEKLYDLGVDIKRVPALGISNSSKIMTLLWMNYYVLLERRMNATFICHFLVTFLMCFPTLIPFNKKCVVYVEGLGSMFSKQTVYRKILRFLLLRPKLVRLFCNEDERHILGYPNDKVTGGIGVDLEKFHKKGEKQKKSSHYNLLYVGRLIEDKGVKDAIEVFRVLLNKGKDVSLSLVGDIYLSNPTSLNRSDIESLKFEFGEKINFPGYSENIAEWYDSSDILLLPSFREGFPVCVMEASAFGIPSFGYEVPGMLDAVKNNINGVLVSYRDVDALVAAVEQYLNLDALKTIHSSSRCFAKSNFCQESKALDIVRILTSLS